MSNITGLENIYVNRAQRRMLAGTTMIIMTLGWVGVLASWMSIIILGFIPRLRHYIDIPFMVCMLSMFAWFDAFTSQIIAKLKIDQCKSADKVSR